MKIKFNQFFYSLAGCLTLVLAAVVFQSCGDEEEDDPTPTLFITNISPEGTVGSNVIISGKGFSTIDAENKVEFFNGVLATDVDANDNGTELTVTVPQGA